MYKHSLIGSLAKLSKKELKEYMQYFKKLHPRQQVGASILDELKKFHPGFDSRNLERNKLHKKIFNTEFNAKRLSNEFGKLRECLEEFLLILSLRKDKISKHLSLLQIARQRGMEELFLQESKKIERCFKTQEDKSIWFWLQKLQFFHTQYFNTNTQHVSKKATEIYEAKKQLDLFYQAANLRYACEYYSRSKIVQQQPQPTFFLAETPHDRLPLFHQVYRLTLQLIQEGGNTLYFDLKDLLIQNLNQFGREDQHAILSYLINHAANNINQGNKEFVNESLELYKYCVQYRLFISEGFFDVQHFLNIVDLASKEKQFTWVENFMKDWKGFLKKEIREETIIICQALIFFTKKEFQKAQDLLLTLKPTNPYGELRYRWLQIAACYELGGYSLDNHCANFEQFIRRNTTFSEPVKNRVLNFIRIVHLLGRAQPDKSQLLQKLEEDKSIYFQTWLIEKINAL